MIVKNLAPAETLQDELWEVIFSQLFFAESDCVFMKNAAFLGCFIENVFIN